MVLQHHTDVAGLTGRDRHLELRGRVAGDADNILARREVAIKATSRSDPMHRCAVDGYIGVDVSSERANRTKNVESTHATGDRDFLLCDRLV